MFLYKSDFVSTVAVFLYFLLSLSLSYPCCRQMEYWVPVCGQIAGIQEFFLTFPVFQKWTFFLEKLAFSPIPCSCQLVWYKAFFKKSRLEQLSKLAAQKGVVVELPEDQPYHNGPPPTPTSFEALPASLLSDCPPTCLEVVPWQDWNVCLSRMCFDISV